MSRAAAEAEVPVPPIVAFEGEGGRFGSPGYLMEHVDGTSVAPRVLRRDELAGARERIPPQLAAALARVHSIDLDAGCRRSRPRARIRRSRPASSGSAPSTTSASPCPRSRRACAGCGCTRRARAARARLVHGDFRLGNFIVDADGLAAVIDWELCHAGDPAEDIGWLCIRSWRFGNDGLPVAGLGELGAFLDAYEEAGGTRPDPERLRWWEAMGNVKWAVICARQAADHLTAGARAPSSPRSAAASASPSGTCW